MGRWLMTLRWTLKTLWEIISQKKWFLQDGIAPEVGHCRTDSPEHKAYTLAWKKLIGEWSWWLLQEQIGHCTVSGRSLNKSQLLDKQIWKNIGHLLGTQGPLPHDTLAASFIRLSSKESPWTLHNLFLMLSGPAVASGTKSFFWTETKTSKS